MYTKTNGNILNYEKLIAIGAVMIVCCPISTRKTVCGITKTYIRERCVASPYPLPATESTLKIIQLKYFN